MAETVGVKVWVEPEETIFKPMPVAVPVAKVWEEVVKPLREIKALPPTKVEVLIQEVPVPVEERIMLLVPEALEVAEEAEPTMAKEDTGDDVPIPTFPLANTLKIWALDDEATVKIGVVAKVEEPWTVIKAVGVEEFKER